MGNGLQEKDQEMIRLATREELIKEIDDLKKYIEKLEKEKEVLIFSLCELKKKWEEDE